MLMFLLRAYLRNENVMGVDSYQANEGLSGFKEIKQAGFNNNVLNDQP